MFARLLPKGQDVAGGSGGLALRTAAGLAPLEGIRRQRVGAWLTRRQRFHCIRSECWLNARRPFAPVWHFVVDKYGAWAPDPSRPARAHDHDKAAVDAAMLIWRDQR